MTILYQLAVLGTPTHDQINDLRDCVANALELFNLSLGQEVGWDVLPFEFKPQPLQSAAVVYFGGHRPNPANLTELLARGIPVLPVVSNLNQIQVEIPSILQPLNCLDYSVGGAQRTATALLECVGLLPKQRRVFISYRRDEARDAALQIFDQLSARHFDVFLDTHGIAPAEDFQTLLWHRLCDSDVLLMLDTPNYFDSRWTSAEFGRALAKNISVLSVGWADSNPSKRTATASRVELLAEEVDPVTGRLNDEALQRICLKLEEVRSQSHAVRSVNLISNIRIAIQTIGGEFLGVGANRTVHAKLPDGELLVIYPTVGVPSSITLHDATTISPNRSVAVVYDHVGLHPKWLGHLDWLGSHIKSARWVKVSEAGWLFADWRN
jgi:hypothetical protein